MTKVRNVQGSLLPDLQPDKPIGRILPSVFTGSNADLMLAVSDYYLTGSVLDVTYGEGKWWDRFTPDPFTYHDKYKVDGVDFTALPEADNSIDTVCFDPPYVHSGGQASTAAADFRHRFGLEANQPGAHFYGLILDGLTECARVAEYWMLVKCMEFAQGGHFHDVPDLVTNRARSLGWAKHDQIVHHTGSGPGGSNIFDPKRARRHHSYLLVFKSAP